MTSLFISYSRKDIETARRLTRAFQERGLDFWIDWEGIPPTVDWWKEIQKGIEEADIFLFLLSPDSAKSNICKQEIEHAVKNGKRLIPIVVRDVQGDIPSELRHLNWIFIRKRTDFAQATDGLMTAIHTDYEWVQVHRQLQNKALEWQRNNNEDSFLLHGKELQEAEFQLRANASKEPSPTDLQQQYVHRSRQSTNRQRRVLGGVGIAAILAIVLLGIYGWVQAGYATMNAETAQAESTRAFNNAETAQAESTRAFDNAATAQSNEAEARKQAEIARSGELAAQSITSRNDDFPVSLLLGVEAFTKFDSVQTRSSLLQNTQTNPRLEQFLIGPSMDVNSVAFSPDGKMLASCSGTMIILWDRSTGSQIGRLYGHSSSVSTVAFSPDGTMLASGGWDESVILWDVKTGQPRGQPLRGDFGTVNSVAFSPDGEMLASGGWGNTILWNVKTGQPVGEPLRGRAVVESIAFSPDGKILAEGSADTTVLLWDVEKRQPIGQPLQGHIAPVASVAFSPDGKILASGGMDLDRTIIFWDVEKHQSMGEPLRGHSSHVLSLAFSPDGKTLASASADRTIILWDMEKRQPLGQPLSEHTGSILSVAFSPDGKTLASSSMDDTIILWDLGNQQPLATSLHGPAGSRSTIALSPDRTMVASSSNFYNRFLWDLQKRQPIGKSLSLPTNSFSKGLAFSPDGKILALGNDDGTIILWDWKTGQPIGQALRGHTKEIWSLAFSPDGNTLASSANNEGTIILWDVKTGQPISRLQQEQTIAVWCVLFSPDGKTLATSGTLHTTETGSSEVINIWDVKTGELKRYTEVEHQVTDLAFSPDGNLLASSDMGGIILRDAKTGEPKGPPLVGYPNAAMAFSPDGRTLASGGGDEIMLWDVKTGQLVGQPLPGDTDSRSIFAFSQDGTTVFSSNSFNTITLWDVNPNSWIQKTCQRVGRNFTRSEWAQYFPNEEYRATCPQWPLEPEPMVSPSPTP